MPGILNYTTTVPVDKTVGEIGRLLGSHGARRVAVDYDEGGVPSAVTFTIPTPAGEREFRLPANGDGVWRTLTRQYESGRVQRRFTTRDQAARVAWRIVKDWLEAQCALLEAGMASIDEVMFAYMLEGDGPGRRTLYRAFVEHQQALPPKQAT